MKTIIYSATQEHIYVLNSTDQKLSVWPSQQIF